MRTEAGETTERKKQEAAAASGEEAEASCHTMLVFGTTIQRKFMVELSL